MNYDFLNEPERRWINMVPAETVAGADAARWSQHQLIIAKEWKPRKDGKAFLKCEVDEEKWLSAYKAPDPYLPLLRDTILIEALGELLRHTINPGKPYEDQPDAVQQALDAFYLTGRKL